MIIKGIFHRYERWNPVHPTSGAFWGMGIGVGCGVGWGPGFGPEVVGFVGAGCGVGFSVGFTVAGFGIGLPANYLFAAPFNALMAARSVGFHISRSIEGETSSRLNSFRRNSVLGEGLHNPFDSMTGLLGHTSNSVCTRLGDFRKRVFSGDKGPKD